MGLFISPTTLQYGLGLEVDDYRRKQNKKAGSSLVLPFALIKLDYK